MTRLLQRPLWRVVERQAHFARRHWWIYLAAGAEPFLFLFSVGVGVGELIDAVGSPTGEPIAYRDFVAPAMLAAASMNTGLFNGAIMFFIKFKYIGSFEPMLATPISTRDLVRGEMTWVLLRAGFYGGAFLATMVAMGLVASWWAVLALPAAILVAFAFAAIGFAVSTWMRSWLDFDLVLVASIPMFLFSATFFPLDRYPGWLQPVVQLSPLYHGADLIRRLCLGGVGWAQLVPVAYLVVLGVAGMRLGERRVAALLQP